MLRVARGSEGRPALEVYDARGITDVSVAVPVAISVLRGACRSARSASLPWSLAWGQLPLGADRIEVVFRSGKLVERVSAVSIAGQFWAVEVPGRYRAVTVSADLNRATARVLTVRELTAVRGMSWVLRKEPFRELDQGRFHLRRAISFTTSFSTDAHPARA
jgi:hypothetical protein